MRRALPVAGLSGPMNLSLSSDCFSFPSRLSDPQGTFHLEHHTYFTQC